MTKQTDQEQLMLELINRARLDPQAEADRYGIDLNDGLPAGTIDASPKQPLAMNDLLIDAARAHSQWMLDTDTFSHKGANESTATDRIQDAGYQLISPWKTGENINLHGVSPGPIDPTASIYEQHRGLFLSSGHRTNILDDEYREVGVGQKIGTFTDDQGQDWDSSMITQDYASSGSGHFITGVIYDDNDNNDFYSVGEGKSLGIQADTTSGTTNITSGSSGGYALHVDDNQAITLTFGSGGGAIIVRVDIGSENVKVDLVNNTMVLTSGDITLVQGITEAKALGVTDANITGSNSADTLTGSKGNNILSGGEGEDFLYGGAGNDTLYGGNALDFLYGEDGDDELHGGGDGDNLEGGAGNDTLYGEAGMDSLSGGDGDDTLYGGDNDDYLIGGAGNDALWGDVGQDTIHGDEGNDTIHGGDDYDIINGGEGNDTLYGDAGADIIHGGAGDDTIEGGDDNDRLIGGAGNDWLTGGAGADTFAYDGQLDQNGNPITPDFGNDEITDLDASADKIRLDMFVDDGGTIRPINRNDVDITDDGSGGSYITAKNPAYFSGQIHVRNSDPTTTETAME
ncbi:CAP domain-containing protein, partial [Thermopetrobacter sp. TC1]|uniref:CAP domain-containing protein n=1 Tax=Thermopetrobacter sp. TC1 TaxID=1495045 RepID=UPI00068E2118